MACSPIRRSQLNGLVTKEANTSSSSSTTTRDSSPNRKGRNSSPDRGRKAERSPDRKKKGEKENKSPQRAKENGSTTTDADRSRVTTSSYHENCLRSDASSLEFSFSGGAYPRYRCCLFLSIPTYVQTLYKWFDMIVLTQYMHCDV